MSPEQVGSLEKALPDVVQSPSGPDGGEEGRQFEPAPAIIRDVPCDLKILVAQNKYPQLNEFGLFLALSDRFTKREGDFFRHFAHTTKIIWAAHRIIYVFTAAAGRGMLYYDIELREPLGEGVASGGMFPTTTLITRNRIYVPVPAALEPAFQIIGGSKEFYVRFDTL